MGTTSSAAAPRWSVIIPAHNARAVLEECLASIDALDTRPFEVIVVDDASTDDTSSLAEAHGAKVIRLEHNCGAGTARNAGVRQATGDVFVFVDADVVLKPDALDALATCFRRNPDAGAVTGCLDGNAPVPDYFSRYKNRYMAYVFSRLPEDVDFLYTSAAAVRREAFDDFMETPTATEDTELGKRLAAAGIRTVYCPDLRVVHLKRYTMRSFFRNDFRVPYSWARIFMRDFDPLGVLRKRRFAHASLRQILGLGLASAGVLGAVAWAAGWVAFAVPLALVVAAIGTNAGFLLYLARHEGPAFALAGVVVSFVDQLVMTAGIVAGGCSRLFSRSRSPGRLNDSG